jgi:hypothetical protein
MGKYELSGIGLPVCDEEISSLRLFDNDEESGGIVGMLVKAGAEPTDYYVASCPFTHHPNDMDQSDHNVIDDYRRESGHRYPPLYRIKIVIEVEPLSDAETEAAWKAHRDAEPMGRFDGVDGE